MKRENKILKELLNSGWQKPGLFDKTDDVRAIFESGQAGVLIKKLRKELKSRLLDADTSSCSSELRLLNQSLMFLDGDADGNVSEADLVLFLSVFADFLKGDVAILDNFLVTKMKTPAKKWALPSLLGNVILRG